MQFRNNSSLLICLFFSNISNYYYFFFFRFYTTLSRLLAAVELLDVSLRRKSWDWRKALGIVSLHVTCGFFVSTDVDAPTAPASVVDDPMPKPLYDRGRVAGPKSHDPAENEKQTNKQKEKMQGTFLVN